MRTSARILSALACACALCALVVLLAPAPGAAGTVLDEWGSVKLPAKPEAKDVTLDPATTALLVLDMQPQTCNAERRPRCLETKAPVAKLIERARAKGMLVAYSLIRNSEPKDIFPEMGFRDGDPVVKSTVDKFLNTELENILKARNIKTVLVTGTAAHGAVLHTASAAAQRGLQIVLPVDGISAEDAFIEAAVVWLLSTGPASKDKTTVTTSGRVGF
jgi:nicotinamidase-related amidase